MTMQAMVLEGSGSIDSAPLKLRELELPEPMAGEIRIRILACGLCRTDLHIIENELPVHKRPVVPGHQVVGIVDRLGSGAARFRLGDRVGIAWLRWTCGKCRYCLAGNENLCPNARFTGYDEDGGYAQFALVREDFAYFIPESLDPIAAAPLLCAGIIGYRALRRAEIKPGARVGLYGFGSSASLGIQIARHLGCSVYVMTRDEKHQHLARQLGATWAGSASAKPPEPLDSAILFAPVGELVLPALEALDYGGTLAIAGIHLSDIPTLNYQDHLFQERNLCSVTANTRNDGEEFLERAARIPVRVSTVPYSFDHADEALSDLAHDRVTGAAVLVDTTGME